MKDNLPTSHRLPESLQIRYGPPHLLGRFLLHADAELRRKGISLYFSSLEELVKINMDNSDTWRPLAPLFNPEVGGIRKQDAIVLLGREENGRVVAAQAARRYLWHTTTLHEEALSLRMFFGDPDAALRRGDRCVISSPTAREIKGCVTFSGAGWYHPDFRGRGLSTLLPRISRALAFTYWETDYTISMIGEKVIAGGMADRCGYTHVEHNTVDLVATPLGTMRCALVWMKTSQLLADLEQFQTSPPSKDEQVRSAIA